MNVPCPVCQSKIFVTRIPGFKEEFVCCEKCSFKTPKHSFLCLNYPEVVEQTSYEFLKFLEQELVFYRKMRVNAVLAGELHSADEYNKTINLLLDRIEKEKEEYDQTYTAHRRLIRESKNHTSKEESDARAFDYFSARTEQQDLGHTEK